MSVHSHLLNLQHMVNHLLFTSQDETVMEQVMNERNCSFYDLISCCKPFKDEQVFVNESILDDNSLPSLTPRYYSVLNDCYQANGSLSEETSKFKLCFTEHKFKNKYGEARNGVGTRFLSTNAVLAQTEFQVKVGDHCLKLPQMTEHTRLLFICMGTGVVPFIGMLERIQGLGLPFSKIEMVFGVRNDEKAFLYKDFLVAFFKKHAANATLHLACSRSLSNNDLVPIRTSKGYLTGVLGNLHLEDKPDQHILICGNKNALEKSVFEGLKISEDVKGRMKKEGRLMMELWSE